MFTETKKSLIKEVEEGMEKILIKMIKNKLEKKEKTKPKVSRRKEIIKIKEEITKIDI